MLSETVDALLVTVTYVVSEAPTLSVTVSCNVKLPTLGAFTITVD